MIRINLLPHKKVKPVEKGVIKLWVGSIAVAAILLVGMAAMYTILATTTSSLEDQKENVKAEIASLKKQVAQVADFENKRKDYERKLAIIAQIKKTRMPLTPILFEINRLVVKDIWVDKLVLKDATFEINFKSEKRESINPFFETLQKSKVFSNLKLDSVEAFSAKREGSKEFPFTVTGSIAGYEDVKRPALEAQQKAQKAKPGKKPNKKK